MSNKHHFCCTYSLEPRLFISNNKKKKLLSSLHTTMLITINITLYREKQKQLVQEKKDAKKKKAQKVERKR